MPTLTEKVDELMSHLVFENPAPAEKWFTNGNFDPMFGKGELRWSAKLCLIELVNEGDLENWRFRFTPKGRERCVKKNIT